MLQIEYSPIVALNRTYALSKVKGNEIAIKEALKIDLKKYHLYFALLANLHEEISKDKCVKYLKQGLSLAKSDSDKMYYENKMRDLEDS